MMGSQERQREKPNQLKEQKVKSLEFFKPTLATTLAIVLAWLLSVRPAQAGYTVTLQQVGPDVVATGSGAFDLTGLTFDRLTGLGWRTAIWEGRITGPSSFPLGYGTFPYIPVSTNGYWGTLLVPASYVSGASLSSNATYSGTTLASLGVPPGVTPGTYLWKWGKRANQNF